MCHAHNAYLAELDYGKELMAKYRRRDGRVSETGPGYPAGFMFPSVGFLETTRTRCLRRTRPAGRKFASTSGS